MAIQKMAVIGSGTMGHGIAKICAAAGLEVNMYDRNPEALKKGYESIRTILDEDVTNGALTAEEADAAYGRVNAVGNLKEAVTDIDMVVEAIVEVLEIKQAVFKELDELCDDRVILATNTSGLSPTDIAEKAVKRDRLVATHFWCPPELIPLIEVIPNAYTRPDVVEATAAWVEQIGKVPVKMNKECHGFIGNRMQYALLREALHIYEQGWADLEEIDKAVEYSFGRRYPVTGPFRSADLGGVDIFYNVSSYLFAELSDAKKPQDAFKKLFDEGKFGLKSGEGFYKWTENTAAAKSQERKDVLNYFLDRDKK